MLGMFAAPLEPSNYCTPSVESVKNSELNKTKLIIYVVLIKIGKAQDPAHLYPLGQWYSE